MDPIDVPKFLLVLWFLLSISFLLGLLIGRRFSKVVPILSTFHAGFLSRHKNELHGHVTVSTRRILAALAHLEDTMANDTQRLLDGIAAAETKLDVAKVIIVHQTEVLLAAVTALRDMRTGPTTAAVDAALADLDAKIAAVGTVVAALDAADDEPVAQGTATSTTTQGPAIPQPQPEQPATPVVPQT